MTLFTRRNKAEIYFSELENDISILENRQKEIDGKLIKWGYEYELKIINFLIDRKMKLLDDLKIFNDKLVKYKEKKI
jgi:hypothetical protein